ncbi:leucine aminopeptidase [Jackrogersella minutella]|nr:leucine aminopeptidase [Jackrogersella minutella]
MGLANSLWAFAATTFLVFPRVSGDLIDSCDGVLVSEALPALINETNIHRHLHSLQGISHVGHGNRMAGSLGHNLTITYIKHELAALGYYVEVQHYGGLVPRTEEATFVVNDGDYNIDPIGWSPSADLVDRTLVPISGSGCTATDYPHEAQGAIVLVGSGGCSFSNKSIVAGKAGADALLIHETTQLTPSFGEPNDQHIPTAKISDEDANYLRNQTHPLQANIMGISTNAEWVSSYNVFGTLEYGDEENTLLVGTHSDSVGQSAGINDNASGIASLLEVAARLAKFKTNSRVKFAFWTAAEPSLLGSKHFVSTAHPEELRRIRLYLDVAMVGSPNGALKVYDNNGTFSRTTGPRGSEHAEATLTHISNRSDYAPFYAANIPFAGLFSGADGYKTGEEADLFGGNADWPYDVNYHQPEDDTENLNVTILMLNTKALAHAVGVYGSSFDGIPAASAAWRYVEAVAQPSCMILAFAFCFLLSYAS